MNNKKYIGILIIIIGLIALVGVVYFMFFYDFSSGRESAEIGREQVRPRAPARLPEQPTGTSPRRAVIQVKERPRAEDKMAEEDLKRMAASFAERFGSYSNQSNYGNIRDLKIFMSAKMEDWANRFIKEEILKNADTDIYYGITTKAVSARVNRFDDDLGQAEILVSARRREAMGSLGNAASFQQDIIIGFIKENGVWRVDSAIWQERR